MHGKHMLKVGDTVRWRGSPPRGDFTQMAVVTSIEQGAAEDFNHTGVEVAELPWEEVKDAIVIFDDNSWDYGYHIRRLTTRHALALLHTLQGDLRHARAWAECWRACALEEPWEQDPEGAASDGWEVPPLTLAELLPSRQ